MKVPYPVVRKALKLCASMVGEKWPQDEWFTLNKDWDLNLFRLYDQHKADLVPVVNGVIKTELGCSLMHYRDYTHKTEDIKHE